MHVEAGIGAPSGLLFFGCEPDRVPLDEHVACVLSVLYGLISTTTFRAEGAPRLSLRVTFTPMCLRLGTPLVAKARVFVVLILGIFA